MQDSDLVYPKPLRLPVGKPIQSKRYLTPGEAASLFEHPLIVEEKMDGTQHFMVWGKLVLFVEDLYFRKTVPYRVPARYALFDVFDRERRFWWSREDRECFMGEILSGKHPELFGKLFLVPLRYRGTFRLEEVPALAEIPSIYGDPKAPQPVYVEGLVFKREGRIPENAPGVHRAKFVRAEFYEQFAEEKITGKNPIDPSLFEKLWAELKNPPCENAAG